MLNEFNFILSSIFYKLVYMSVIASFVGLVILIITKIFRKKISPKWISRLWLLVFIALICPIQISSIFSIYNYLPDNGIMSFNYNNEETLNISDEEVSKIMNQESKQTLNENDSDRQKEQIQTDTDIPYIKPLIIDIILPYTWLIIGGTLNITYIITYIIFAIELNKYENSKDERVWFILEKCKAKLKINKQIRIIKQDRVKTPALFGIFNIWIILPNNISKLTDYEIKYILMHELSHYKRKDNVLKLCLTVLKNIYFFNPIIYIIHKQIIKDIEVATDEMAVNGFNKENKKEYCRTLIKLTDEYAERNFVAKTLAISDNKNNLERRIIMIKLSDGFIKYKALISGISIIMILILGILFLTKPQTKNARLGNNVKILSEAEAISLGNEKFNKMKEYYWSWMTNNIEGSGLNSRIKEEYTQEIKDMCTENAFKQFMEYWNISPSSDGYYNFSEGIGANPRYISDELTLEAINENKIEFIDTVKYDDDPVVKRNKFVLIKIGENWLVEDYTSPY